MDATTIRTQLIDAMIVLKQEADLFTMAPTANYAFRRYVCGLLVTLSTHPDGDRIALYQEMPYRLDRLCKRPTDEGLLFGGPEDFKLVRSGPFNNRQLKAISEYVAEDIEEARIPIEDERLERELFGDGLLY